MADTIKVGASVDPFQSIVLAKVYDANKKSLIDPGEATEAVWDSGFGGGTHPSAGATAASFTVYWNDKKNGLYLYNPKVYHNGEEIKVTGAGVDRALKDGDSGWLVVTKTDKESGSETDKESGSKTDKESGSKTGKESGSKTDKESGSDSSDDADYKAEVVTTAPKSNDEKTVAVIPLFTSKLNNGFPEITQYHTGVVTFGGGGGTFLGNTKDSEKISPSVAKFVSGSDSNVLVETNGDEIKINVYYV